MHKELKAIEKELRKQGFSTWIRKNGHMAVYQGQEYVATFGGTPSDFRGWKNSLAKCRRRGFIWPPP
ncbi:MAG TPA: hypothetical protein VGM94_06625 [Galbitalea sp.]|jgi:hypothetical protein